MSNKLELQNNNIDLQGILTKVNALPKKENIDEEVDTIENLTEQIKLALEGKAAGGNGKIFAAIGVTYPEGSICTCTNGTKTMEAENTNGQWIFAIPETGTWTVTATDGTDTTSEAVEITSESQSVSVELSYELWLYKDGEEYADVTGGWKVVNNSAGTGSKQSNRIYLDYTSTAARNSNAYTNSKINIDNVKLIKAKIEVIRNNEHIGLGLTSTNTNSTPTDKNLFVCKVGNTTTTTGELILELDVSKMSGEYYICIAADKAGIYITEVYAK
jgi:hypothetical protein